MRDLAILAAATVFTRYIFRSPFLYDIDSVNFALALQRFDPAAHQPHPPGYFLYVCLGRLSNAMFHDANTALAAISILASGATVAMIHLLASVWFECIPFRRAAAGFAGLLFMFSPLAWFHGAVALTYSVEALFSSVIGYLCWRVYRGENRFIPPCAIVLGLAAGFRPSSLVVLGPLFWFSARRAPRRFQMWGTGALALVLTVWLLPMLFASGGAGAYVSSLWSLWTLVPAKQTIFTSTPVTSLARLSTIAGIYGLAFGPAALLPLRTSKAACPDARIKRFTWVWLGPGLLLFTLVYLKFVNSGYLLVLAPPACLWLGYWAAEWWQRCRVPAVAGIVCAAAAAINFALFLRAPLYFSYTEMQRSRRELAAAVASVRSLAKPQQTLIVGFDSHFLGYRHAGYYLPKYLTIQFPEVPVGSHQGLFIMQNRDTRVVSRLRVGSFRDFILFPLPSSEEEYSAYIRKVRARFPAGDLRAVTHDGLELLTGPIRSLRVLFPNTIDLEDR